jgi:hypothetical protein
VSADVAVQTVTFASAKAVRGVARMGGDGCLAEGEERSDGYVTGWQCRTI